MSEGQDGRQLPVGRRPGAGHSQQRNCECQGWVARTSFLCSGIRKQARRTVTQSSLTNTMGYVACWVVGCDPEEGITLASRSHGVAGQTSRVVYRIQIKCQASQHLKGDSMSFLKCQNHIVLCCSMELLHQSSTSTWYISQMFYSLISSPCNPPSLPPKKLSCSGKTGQGCSSASGTHFPDEPREIFGESIST